MVQRYKFNCKYRNYLADNFVLGAIILFWEPLLSRLEIIGPEKARI